MQLQLNKRLLKGIGIGLLLSIPIWVAIILLAKSVISWDEGSFTNTTIPRYPYISVPNHPYNLTSYSGVTNPILNVTNVNGSHQAADPFLFIENNSYYLFFEEVGDPANISLATSTDGITWIYQGVVLNKSWHQSFPFVLKHNSTYYLIPETDDPDPASIFVYTANKAEFPYHWHLNTTLLNNSVAGNVDDAVFFRYGGKWWCLYSGNNSDLYAGYGNSLVNASSWNWTLPINPIYTTSTNERPGGRPLVIGNNIYLYLQNNSKTYGERLEEYVITSLTASSISISKASTSFLKNSGSGFNSRGMHHADCWWEDYQLSTGSEKWVCAVDGIDNSDRWSIAIYSSPTYRNIPTYYRYYSDVYTCNVTKCVASKGGN